MTTTADNPPVLTPTEVNAALTWIEPGARSLLHLARDLDLAPHELLDIITRPHVDAFIEAARTLTQSRAEIVAAHEHADARCALVKLAQNTEADPWLRLRAATAVLMGTPAVPGRRGSGMGSPTVPGARRPDRSTSNQPDPVPTSAPNQRATLRALPAEAPSLTPTEIFTATIEALQSATPDNPEALTPIQNLCARPLRGTTITDFLARTQLHLAAGAELVDHTLHQQGPARTMRSTFKTTCGPLTFEFTCHDRGAAISAWRLTSIAPVTAPDDLDSADVNSAPGEAPIETADNPP